MSDRITVDTNGTRLSARADGGGNMPWLLLSNSLATDLTMWDDQIEPLSKLRRILRYDARGHGRSEASDGPYSLDLLVRDAIAVMDHFGIPSADILGLSLGGMTALGLGLDHPDRVNSLICCCARGDMPAPAIAAWDERIKAVSEAGMAAVVEATLGRWFTKPTHEQRPGLIEHARRMILGTSVKGYNGCAAAVKGVDYRRCLPSMSRPVLYVAGEVDPAAPPEAIRDVADATPGAKFEMIAGAAHIANLENAAAFNEAVRSFLQAIGNVR